MLSLLTGQPGNGKTLWIIKRIAEMAKKEGRPVLYSGIPLTEEGKRVLGWTELGDITKLVERWRDPEDNTEKDRFTLPVGAIVVIDEAQRIYRVRPQGSAVPPHVAAFETHRHGGLDFWLLSQHPQLLDTHVRKLAGYHVHVRRPAGLEKTNVYEWEVCQTDPLSDRAKKDARHSMWEFPRDVYSLYESSEQHTHKRNLPWKQIGYAALAVAVVVSGVVFTANHVLSGAGVVGLVDETTESGSSGARPVARRDVSNPWDAEFRAPRVAGFGRTAPMYDELQRAKSQPVVAGCMRIDYVDTGVVDCRCTTSQGNRLPTTTRHCIELVERGWFDETREVSSAKEENIRYLNARDGGGRGEGAEADRVAGSTES